MNGVDVEYRVLDARMVDAIPLTSHATDGSGAKDLRAALDAPLTLAPGESVLVPSGIAIHIGDPGWCALILPRSGLGHKHGLVLGNLVGLIDADYQGPLMISCWNRSREPFTIAPGDRVAQLLLVPVGAPRLKRVAAFAPSARGTGGFGSTGVD
jgi:dUTP pyrophosphatase